MADKITELTKEQEAKLAGYRDKWESLGLSTLTLDREKAAAAIDQVYACAGVPAPKIKIWLRSPREGVIGAWWLRQVLKSLKGRTLDQVRTRVLADAGAQGGEQVAELVGITVLTEVRDMIKPRVGAQVRSLVKSKLEDLVKETVRDKVWGQVWSYIKEHINPQLEEKDWDAVWSKVWGQIWAQVWAQPAQVGDQVGDKLKAEIRAQVREGQMRTQAEDMLSVQASCGGLHDASLLCGYDFLKNELGVEELEKLSGLMAAAEHCGWFWPFGGAVIITEKPSALHRDSKNRLHNETGMAVEYSDGWGIWEWYGTRVESWVVTNPEKITIDAIIDEKSAGIRRVMRERFGIQAFFSAMIKDETAQRVDRKRDPNGLPMTLFRYFDRETALHFVHVYNGVTEADGTRREFIIPCKNICSDVWDSLVGTYPALTQELKNNPRKFEVLQASIG